MEKSSGEKFQLVKRQILKMLQLVVQMDLQKGKTRKFTLLKVSFWSLSCSKCLYM